MLQILDYLAPILAAVITGIASSWLAVNIALARHDERLKGLKDSLTAMHTSLNGSIEGVRSVASSAHRRIDNLLAGRPSGD